MNLTELAHSLLTGSWRHERDMIREARAFNAKTRGVRDALIANHQARMQLYAGAEPGLKRKHANVMSSPEDYKQAWERIVLIRAARQMEEDHGFFDGLLDDFETYVVGDELSYTPNTGNEDANAVIREYLEYQFAEADYSGRLDLTKIAQVGVRSMKRDGECGFVPVDVGDAIKIHYYSGDCIGNPMIATPASPQDFNGIVVDPDTGSPIEYQVFKRAPKMNSYTFDRTFRPGEFWHYYDPFRLQQYHGVSVFKNAIRDAFDIDEILEYAKLNIKWRSSQLPTVHTDTGRPRGNQFGYFGFGGASGAGGSAPVSPSGRPEPLTVDVDGVTSTFMKTGDQVVDYPHDFPNAQLQVTIEELRRQCCKGAKLPYEFVYRSDDGGVVQRFWVNKAENTFNKDKAGIRRVLLNPYKNRSIQKGIDTGELDLRKFGDLDTDLKRFRGQWQMGRSLSVDYGRENDTDIALIEAGLMSPQDKTADSGRNLTEIRAEIKANAIAVLNDAKEVAFSTGLPIDQVIPFLSKKWPNPPPNQTPMGGGGPGALVPGAVPAAGPAKALIEKIGIGGSQALTQVLQQVASGSIPRESGINTLTIVFGISPEEAAKLIPQQGSAKPVEGAADIPKLEPLAT
jgi:capsid protein